MKFDPFQSVPVGKKGRTNFDESHNVCGTFPLSTITPVFVTETIPGDVWKVNAFNLTKLETLIAPAMQQIDASLLWFKIPKRLVFKHFKKWYSGGEDGKDKHQKPHIYLRHFIWELANEFGGDIDEFDEILNVLIGPGSLWQYLGLPVPLKYDSVNGVWKMMSCIEMFDFTTPITHTGQFEEPEKVDSDYIDIMPFMAYQMLYDQYFRDQTLSYPVFKDCDEGDFTIQDEDFSIFYGENEWVLSSTGRDLSEGGEISAFDFARLLLPFNRAWRKDYFTSALPTPQRGPEVTLNMFEGETLPVQIDEPGPIHVENEIPGGDKTVTVGQDSAYHLAINNGLEDPDNLLVDSLPKQSVDLSGLSPITIVAFRNLFKLQQFLEKNNIGGGRFIETILAQWGERVPDFTVQRAQFIRATSFPVQISEVVATANTAGVNSIVGDIAGRARTQGNLGKVRIYTHEPSFIFGLYCVTAPGAYASQGIPRMFQRITRFDEPWRDFQHIGEQAVKIRELYYAYAFNNSAANDQDFGYQQRFSEYKYMPNRVVGDFQTSLAYWHMARMFSGVPRLNNDFITQHLDPRIFATAAERPVISDFWFEASAKRKLSKFSTPKLN